MSEHKAQKPAVTVVETQTSLTRLRDGIPPRGKLLRYVVVLAVIVLAAVGVFNFISSRQKVMEEQQQAEAGKPKPLEERAYRKALVASQSAMNPAATVEFVQKNVTEGKGRQIDLANAYANNKQFDKSLEIFDKLRAANNLTYAELAGGASIAEQAGNKAKAVDYLQQAVKLAQTGEKGPLSDSDIARMQANIKALQQ